MDFEIIYTPPGVITRKVLKDTATVLEKGDMVTLSSGLLIKAVAASTALGYCIADAPAGETEVLVLSDPNIIFAGTGDANYAVTMQGTEVDLVGTTTQLIDVGASTTDVFKIEIGTEAGTVGSANNIRVRINKPL